MNNKIYNYEKGLVISYDGTDGHWYNKLWR